MGIRAASSPGKCRPLNLRATRERSPHAGPLPSSGRSHLQWLQRASPRWTRLRNGPSIVIFVRIVRGERGDRPQDIIPPSFGQLDRRRRQGQAVRGDRASPDRSADHHPARQAERRRRLGRGMGAQDRAQRHPRRVPARFAPARPDIDLERLRDQPRDLDL